MFLKKDVSEAEYRDTALAFLLVCFLLWLVFGNEVFLYIGLAILLFAMVLPKGMKYPAMVWFGFSNVLGTVVSRIILAIVYIVLVLPVGMARRLMGKDAMRIKSWRNGEPSAYVVRNVLYQKEHLEDQF